MSRFDKRLHLGLVLQIKRHASALLQYVDCKNSTSMPPISRIIMTTETIVTMPRWFADRSEPQAPAAAAQMNSVSTSAYRQNPRFDHPMRGSRRPGHNTRRGWRVGAI